MAEPVSTASSPAMVPGRMFVTALMGIITIGPLSLTIFLPALPAIQREFESEQQLVQLTLSLPFISVVLAPAIAGGLADRIGRHPVVMASILVVVASSLVAALAPNLGSLVVARTVLGVAGTCAMVVGRALILDCYPPEDLTAAMARYAAAPIIAIMIAPILGGIIIDGLGWRAIFYILLAVGLVLLFLTHMTRHAVRRQSASAEPEGSDAGTPRDRPGRRLLRSLALWGYIGQSMLHFGVAVGFVGSIPYILENRLGRSATDFGLGLLLIIGGMLAGVMVARRFARKVSTPAQVLIGSAVGLAASITFPVAIEVMAVPLSTPLLFGSATLVAAGIGLAMPASQAGIVAAVPELAGTASGLSSCAQLMMAAVFVHLTAAAWTQPELALGLISAVGMAIALAFSVIPIVTAKRGVLSR